MTKLLGDRQKRHPISSARLVSIERLTTMATTTQTAANNPEAMMNRSLLKTKKHTRINSQLGWMIFFFSISFVTSLILNGRHLIPGFGDTGSPLYFIRQLLRIINFIVDSFFPILSVFYCSDINLQRLQALLPSLINKLTNRVTGGSTVTAMAPDSHHPNNNNKNNNIHTI